MTALTAGRAALPRSDPRFRRIALGLATAIFVFTATGWLFLALSLNANVPPAWGFRGFPGIFAIAFGWIGLLVAMRQPRNPIGWAFLSAGLLSAIQVAGVEYASYALFGAGAGLPGGIVGAWLNDWIWIPLVGVVTLPVFLYFPDGRLPSPRWSAALWIGGAGLALAMVFTATAPGPMQTFGLPNPVGIAMPFPIEGAAAGGGRSISALALIGLFSFGVMVFASASVPLRRFGRSEGEARQQLKWFAASAVVVAMMLVNSFFTTERFAQVGLILAMVTVPIAIGIAILRYRLYEIDTLINHAIVYGVLTAVLAGLYSASIGLFQRLFVAVTGEKSDAAIVITTLILASAFTPVRSWLQAATDRRFKSAADARKQLDNFREDLRLVSEALDASALRARFLDEAMAAMGAPAARLLFVRGGSDEQRGEWSAPAATCPLTDQGVIIGRIELAARSDGTPYTKAELAELEKTAAVVARAYVLAERFA